MADYNEIMTALNSTGLPCAYSHFRTNVGESPPEPPFLVYIGRGQYDFEADNTYYYKRNQYQVEYYFKAKDEAMEELIESKLLEAGFLYEKSEDVFVEDMDAFLIYYYV
jgi:hypothetical protein